MSGNLIAIPIVNVYGFLYQKRNLMDRRDLNRSFPGSASGSIASRLANVISAQILPLATHCIDLHTGSNHRFNLPQIRTNLDMPENEALSLAFNSPVILHSTYRDGSLREYANEKGIPFLLYEAGEALRFDELSIRSGINGVLSVMANLGMISAARYRVKQFTPVISRHSSWIRAPQGGIVKPLKKAGNKIIKGQTIALISNPSNQVEYKLQTPFSGIIIGDNKLPLVQEGEALFHVASFDSLSAIEEQLGSIQEVYNLTDDDAIF
jgi:predicted deacylase